MPDIVCEKCKSEKEPILCTSSLSGFADVDTEDADYSDLSEIMIDPGFYVWMHICRDCHEILDSGVEDWGEIKPDIQHQHHDIRCKYDGGGCGALPMFCPGVDNCPDSERKDV